VLADRLGLDVIGLREHHRTGFAIAAPDSRSSCAPRG
jgi:alkanesulfonate monooxygenase SsuD/methylene tetrahydromethanopterin reductase-like flavin-dependent oxidoreductase (luciferase family)